jgi:hypothetical protein
MNCPHCDHPESRVTETRSSPEFDRRIRICRGCGKTFQTLERVAVFAGRAAGYIEAVQAPALAAVPESANKRPKRFVASLTQEWLDSVSADVQPLLVEWWNVSRLSKHGSKAVWTEKAWQQNIKRVAALPHWKQQLLAKAGVESGWQALNPEYMRDVAPPAEEGLAPKSGAMQEAIAAWNSRAA